LNIIKLGSDLSVPIFHRDGVGTLLSAYSASAGCQGFIGPFPSAFLDKRCVKNYCKDRDGVFIFPNTLKFFCWTAPGKPLAYALNFSTFESFNHLVYKQIIKYTGG
jgi:hypothetical protein